jgi:hypothetical protein
MKKAKPSVGDFFYIKLEETTFVIGQVLLIPSVGLPKYLCSFYGQRFSQVPSTNNLAELKKSNIIAIIFVTPESLKGGSWPVFANAEPTGVDLRRDLSQLIENNYIGCTIIGSGIVDEFMLAWHGLAIWNDWHNPSYLDGLLLPGVKRPENVKMK